MTTCITCQILEQDPEEPNLHRMIRMLERTNTELTNRLLTAGDRRRMQDRIDELEAALERANRRRTA